MAFTIAKDVRVEKTIEKSRFICSLKKCATEEEAQDFIKAVKKEFWDATHNCSAYVIEGTARRSSDDGEPAGTAGVPMLAVLQKAGVVDTAAVVTRYFGGIKLGAGGLVRAYSGSVSQALEAAGLARRIVMQRSSFTEDAARSGKILNILYGQDLFELEDVIYGERTEFILSFPKEKKPEVEKWLEDALQQHVELCDIEEVLRDVALPEGD